MTNEIQATATREEIVEAIQDLVNGFNASQDPYVDEIIKGIILRADNALLSEIQLDFETKARGGTGRDGIKWAPLKLETIARRRATKADLAGVPRVGFIRPSLTVDQNKRWKYCFINNLMRLRHFMPLEQAKGIAAARAWIDAKAAGARTLLQILGGRQVEILRDTGELYRSFTPFLENGLPGPHKSGAPGQIINYEPFLISVGSTKKPWHHRGNASKGLPARPFWPLNGSMPGPWMESVLEALSRGIVLGMTQLINRVGHNV